MPDSSVTASWRRRILPRERVIVEAVHGVEMKVLGYPAPKRSMWEAWVSSLLPFKGEFPVRWRWWRDWRRPDKKLAFLFAFFPSYIVSRALFAVFLMSGRFKAE